VIPDPQEPLMDAYRKWRGWAEKSAGDYSFHVAVTWWSDSVRARHGHAGAEEGVNSFKHFMAYKNAIMCDDETLVNSFKRALELGAMPTVHAENGELVYLLQAEMKAKGITGPEGHPLSRPPDGGGRGGQPRHRHRRRAERADLRGARVCMRRSADAIARARARGQRVYGEVLAGHLVHGRQRVPPPDFEYAAGHVMSPPFRPKGHQDSAVARPAVRQPAHHRHRPLHLLRRAEGGWQGRLQPRSPTAAAAWKNAWRCCGRGREHRRLTPSEFVAVTSANAAKLFNIYPRKGCIAPGADADLVLWDPQARKTLSAKTQHSKGDFNIFEGRTVQGIPSHTLSRAPWCVPRRPARGARRRPLHQAPAVCAATSPPLARKAVLEQPVPVAR
jgi:dihydropyrimidinase